MTGPSRRAEGGLDINRAVPVSFSFDGRAMTGLAGDTLASALLANGVRIVGRSFKYHRPRGIYGSGVEEPNALVDLSIDGRTIPNAQATTTPLVPGLIARSVNATPDAATDRNGFIDAFARFLPAGFYYKTFIWPDWHLFEPRIRAMAGLGRLGPAPATAKADQIHRSVDVLVVGAGPAGLAAALAAARTGKRVMLVDDGARPGGSLLADDATIEGQAGRDWASDSVARLRALPEVTVLSRTTAFGIYDHNLVGVLERDAIDAPGWSPDRLWYVRAARVILATGAIERPLVFADNDRPGVMSAHAALAYCHRYGVLAGGRVVVATNNSTAYAPALALAMAGARVTLLDARATPDVGQVARVRAAGVEVRPAVQVEGVTGVRGVEGVVTTAGPVAADGLVMSGGWTPTVHLHCQARGKLLYDPAIAALVPAEPVTGVIVAGAANGTFDLAAALAEGHVVGGGDDAPPRTSPSQDPYAIEAVWPKKGLKKRAWIDFQNDVTSKDVELAARENYRSIEHLKRYTTLGMATDQGKTSNMNGLALMAAITGQAIPEVGTTTYRPPFTPVSLAAMAGVRRGELMAPVKRLPLETTHRRLGASFGDYGGWLRPRYYGRPAQEAALIRDEILAARQNVALFDASSLGKIEVIGPDAARFLDFIYYNKVSTLQPGRVRYGFMLRENGVVYDDGVLARLAPDRFVVSCSSSHTTGVVAALEEWRQDSFDTRRVFIHDMTAAWSTVAVTGPLSKGLVAALDLGIDLADTALPHMAVAEGMFEGTPARLARVSFTGDRSYELSVPASKAAALWQALALKGRAFGARPIGLEALTVLRAEKGFIIVGRDSDGTSMPHDLGMTGPREKRSDEFVGKRSLFLEAAMATDRRQLVGLEPDGPEPLGNGAHGADLSGPRPRSIGYVTSSFFSPVLQKPFALGLIEAGRARQGDTIDIHHLGTRRRAKIVSPCFLDAEGARLNA